MRTCHKFKKIKSTLTNTVSNRLLCIVFLFSHFLLGTIAFAASEDAPSTTADVIQTGLNEPVYVRDTLYVPLRGGQSTEHRVLRQGIKSGTALTRIAIDTRTGYSEVRMADGQTGWIPSQYLVTEPIAAMRLVTTRKALAKAMADYNLIKKKQKLETAIYEQAGVTISTLNAANAKLQIDYDNLLALSADAVNISKNNAQLKSDQQTLDAQIDTLLNNNAALQDDSTKNWLLRGAGITFLGLLFGFWAARKIYHRSGVDWN